MTKDEEQGKTASDAFGNLGPGPAAQTRELLAQLLAEQIRAGWNLGDAEKDAYRNGMHQLTRIATGWATHRAA